MAGRKREVGAWPSLRHAPPHLHELPFDKVKIDKSFILKLGSDPSGIDYIGAIISLEKCPHLDVTAEGIERPMILQKLADPGCTSGQGSVFGKAVPAELLRIAVSQLGTEMSAWLPRKIVTGSA
jgi:EAL domain-containing protein (putative c-di-GMP-specific phosphodiesterase class I)